MVSHDPGPQVQLVLVGVQLQGQLSDGVSRRRHHRAHRASTIQHEHHIQAGTANSSLLTFNNPNNSSPVVDEETVDQIRKNAPRVFNSQLRLVSTQDYESFMDKSFSNIIIDSKVVNNQSFINEYIQYFYNILQNLSLGSKSERLVFFALFSLVSSTVRSASRVDYTKTTHPCASTSFLTDGKRRFLMTE